MENTHTRHSEHPVEPLILERWSPRAFNGSDLPANDIHTILEAARWAPSAYNFQPWRFLYARRGSEHWQRFIDLLLPFNAAWAAQAGVLLFILSDKLIQTAGAAEPVPSHSHSFDAGAAWALLALQATRLGYHAHAMTGIHFDQIRAELGVPDRFHLEAAVAIGQRGDPASLPEGLRQREQPSPRNPIADFAFEGGFPQ